MFKQMRIRTKIFVTAGIVGLLFVIIAIDASYSFKNIKREMVDKIGVTQLSGHKNLIKYIRKIIRIFYTKSLGPHLAL